MPLFHVADGVKHIYATGLPCFEVAANPGELVCASFFTPPYRVAKPAANEIVTVDRYLCARSGERITCTDPEPDARHDTRSVEVAGAVKLHPGWQLCIESADGSLACTSASRKLEPPVPITWATPTP